MKKGMAMGLGSLLSVAVVAVPALSRTLQSWTARYPLPPGGRVTVAHVQGSISVEGWDRAEVELTVMKGVASQGAPLEEVRVAIEPHADSLDVHTLYTGETKDPAVVDYRLRVPRQVRLEDLHTVNGDIVVRDIEGAVEARTLNGNIVESSICGSVVAHTVNGNVSVNMRSVPGRDGILQLESINGDVYLLLPARANAELEMNTVAGRIESAHPFTAGAVLSDTAVRARLGRGGVRVQLRTVRGNIRLAEVEDLL